MTSPASRPAARLRRRDPGVHPFSFGGGSGSREFRELERLAADSPLAPTVVALSPAAYTTGLRLAGSTGDAYVTHLSGILARAAGASQQPTLLHISDSRLSGGSGTLCVRSDSTPYEYAVHDRSRVISVAVPIQSLSFDLSAFDLATETIVDAPPVALHGLRSLAAVATSEVTEWIASSPDAIDRYLVGVVSLILSAVFDERSDQFVEQDRTWLRTRARALIESRFYDPALAPSTIAAKLGVSLRSLHRAFEGEPGVAEELRGRRVAAAAALLGEVYCRHLPIHEVARRAGFASMATFERSFVNVYEVPPKRFRARALAAALDLGDLGDLGGPRDITAPGFDLADQQSQRQL